MLAPVLAPDGVLVTHRVQGFSEHWVISEEQVAEAPLHDACAELMKLVLVAFVARTGRDARVYRNLAVRVDPERPNMGFDPDLCLVEPAPPDGEDLESLRLWKDRPPSLAIEVVSRNHPHKDYAESPDKCAAAGVTELVIFDPLLAGPRAYGGPFRLQLWRRRADGGFERLSSSGGPAWSSVVRAWFVVTNGGRRLRIADDREGHLLWPTPEEEAEQRVIAERRARETERHQREAERREKEAERREKEAERERADAALRRVAELEAELARRGAK